MLGLIFTIIGVLAAILVIPEIRRILRLEKSYPLKFVGEVGHEKKSFKFLKFIYKNVGSIVYIDIYMDDEIFEGQTDVDMPYFVLYDEEKAEQVDGVSFAMSQTGTEININNSSNAKDFYFGYSRGTYILKGYFAILAYGGPHQGLMGVNLKPLNIEDAIIKK